MTRVPLIVLEDQELSEIEKTKAGLPLEQAGYQFLWHPSSGTRIDSRVVRQRFEEFLSGREDPHWGAVPSPAIVVMDLGYDIGLLESENKQLMNWLGGMYYASPRATDGLYVLGRLLGNAQFKGLIVVATSAPSAALKAAVHQVAAQFQRSDVKVITGEDAPSGTLPGGLKKLIDDAIGAFLREFGDIRYRLWPPSTETWFSSANLVVHHAFATSQRDLLPETFRTYLYGLLGFNPPESWLADDQIKVLFEELTHLTGSKCAAQTSGGLNLTLGGVILLLAASTASAASWLGNINWTRVTPAVLPSQDSDASRRAISALCANEEGLFPLVSTDEYDSSLALVRQVGLTSDRLQIVLGFDCRSSNKPGRPALLTKVLNLFERVTRLRGLPSMTGRSLKPISGSSSCLQKAIVAGWRSARSTCGRLRLGLTEGANTIMEFVPCQ